jgi:hypothetical protein
MLNKLSQKVDTIYGFQNPKERVILDQRVRFLKQQFEDFEYLINPYHIQSGLLLDVDITSIKRKKYTLNSMANVLNEFLHGVSKGFQDAAFAAFKRRRSTVREDIGMNFETTYDEPVAAGAPAANADTNFVAASDNASVKGQADVSPKQGNIDDDELQEL